jgi:hypothetical protein
VEQILVNRTLRDLQSFGDFTNRQSLVPEFDGPMLPVDPMLDASVHTLTTIQPSYLTTEILGFLHPADSRHPSEFGNRDSKFFGNHFRLCDRIERHHCCKNMNFHFLLILNVIAEHLRTGLSRCISILATKL